MVYRMVRITTKSSGIFLFHTILEFIIAIQPIMIRKAL